VVGSQSSIDATQVQALLIVWQLVVVSSRGLITPWIDMAVATDVRI
jgi:hypothetical protein